MKKLCVSMTLVVVSLGLATPAQAAPPSGSAVHAGVDGGARPQLLCWIWPKHCL